jgi:hypothetical protein
VLCNLPPDFCRDGDRLGVIAANSTRGLDGEASNRGGRWWEGRVDGGWFSASEDCRDPAGDGAA